MPLDWGNGRYSCFRAHIGHGLQISVTWESSARLTPGEPHYNVSVFGQALKGRADTVEAGQARAVAVARKWLMEALEQLDAK